VFTPQTSAIAANFAPSVRWIIDTAIYRCVPVNQRFDRHLRGGYLGKLKRPMVSSPMLPKYKAPLCSTVLAIWA